MKRIKKFLSVLLIFSLTILLPLNCFATSNLSTATTITDGAYYYIRNKNSGHYLDAENSLNFNVIQYGYHGALNQTWKLICVSGNTYRLENRSPYYQNQGRKCLSVSEVNNEVDLFYYNSSLSTQQWTITLNSDGTFTVRSMWDNKVLQTESASTSSPANVIKATANGSNSQKWYFERIPSPNALTANLKVQFPSGQYWNHAPSSANSQTSVRSTACSHHSSGCNYYGTCGCNSFSTAIQCKGYALYIGYRYYLSDPRNWDIVNCDGMSNSEKAGVMSFLRPGDIIYYNNHYIYVTSIASDLNSFYFTDVNNNGVCGIRWGGNYNKSDFCGGSSKALHQIIKAPYVLL